MVNQVCPSLGHAKFDFKIVVLNLLMLVFNSHILILTDNFRLILRHTALHRLCSSVSWYLPALNRSHRAPSVCTPEGCRRRFCPSSDTLGSSDLYLCTSTSLYLSPPLCLSVPFTSTSLQLQPIVHFFLVCLQTHTAANTLTQGQACAHKCREIAPSLTECRREVSNPVPGRVGLLGDQSGTVGGSKDGGHRRVDSWREDVRMSNTPFRWSQ